MEAALASVAQREDDEAGEGGSGWGRRGSEEVVVGVEGFRRVVLWFWCTWIRASQGHSLTTDTLTSALDPPLAVSTGVPPSALRTESSSLASAFEDALPPTPEQVSRAAAKAGGAAAAEDAGGLSLIHI